MKIGLIQTRGIGDIIIAAPIAHYFIGQGHDVFWPVESSFHSSVQAAFPDIHFIPVYEEKTGYATVDYFYNQPKAELERIGCVSIFCLYSHLLDLDIIDKQLAWSLKFDEYKYAVAGVPFDQKWQLSLTRNPEREQALFERLAIHRSYVLVHDQGEGFKLDIQLPEDLLRDYQIVRISTLTDNPFDWLGVIERAGMLLCVDSCFANLAEQLNLCSHKYLFLRSHTRGTPVFKNGWFFRSAAV
ncbi:MAG: hypothetical protein ACOYL3_20675 [Desulfuromonadaceae bacterium]